MRPSAFAIILILSSLCFATSVPSWVQPGVTVVYDGISGYYSNGQYTNPVATTVTLRVNSVAGNTVAGTTYVEIPTMPGYRQTFDWTCIEGGVCDWRFWVDPANPTGSAKGPNGETYSVVNSGPYSHGSYSNPDATLMAYQNAGSGVEYHLTFETRTGLIVAYAEKYPSQHTFLYFKSINQDLSSYQPPQAANPLSGANGVCPGFFILVFPLAAAAACGVSRDE
ncbi:Uncharacterised protein [uncultured archaeon]|nr:Uncharacterised protein [uncultured archaeon]